MSCLEYVWCRASSPCASLSLLHGGPLSPRRILFQSEIVQHLLKRDLWYISVCLDSHLSCICENNTPVLIHYCLLLYTQVRYDGEGYCSCCIYMYYNITEVALTFVDVNVLPQCLILFQVFHEVSVIPKNSTTTSVYIYIRVQVLNTGIPVILCLTVKVAVTKEE